MRIFNWKILHWEDFTDYIAEIKVLRAKLEQSRKSNEELRNNTYNLTMKNSEKGKKMSYNITDMNCTLSLKRPFEILCAKTKKFVQHEGFVNPEDAQKYAEKLAAEHPGQEFVVYGPFSVSKADIPVATTKWKVQSPPPEDKMVVLNG